jgi:hypothetical protein
VKKRRRRRKQQPGMRRAGTRLRRAKRRPLKKVTSVETVSDS